jgi:hypothetical protein
VSQIKKRIGGTMKPIKPFGAESLIGKGHSSSWANCMDQRKDHSYFVPPTYEYFGLLRIPFVGDEWILYSALSLLREYINSHIMLHLATLQHDGRVIKR